MKEIILSNLIQFFIAAIIWFIFFLIGKMIVKKFDLDISEVQLAKNYVYIFFLYKAVVVIIDILFDVDLDFIKYLSNIVVFGIHHEAL